MADISQYLQDILDAVYGEQVRGSIHDAIEIINEAMEVSIDVGTAVSSPSSSSTGFFVGSLYINTNTFDLWKCIGTNSWQRMGNVRGNGITSLTKTSTVGNVDTYTILFDDGVTETFTVTNGIDGQDGSIWYKGTALTGTGTSITGFPAKQNDFYLNSSTGMVYVCTKTGGAIVPDAAEWDYVMTLTGGGGGGSSILVIDNLNSPSSTDALSANQGRVLKNLVDQKVDASSLSEVAISGSYNDLLDRPDPLIEWVTGSVTNSTSVTINDERILTTSKIVCMLADNGGDTPVKYSNVYVSNYSISITFASATTASIAIGISNT